MPVKLTVSFLLIALCVSAVSGMVPYAQDKMAETEATCTAEKINETIDRLWNSDAGDKLTVNISLPSGCTLLIHTAPIPVIEVLTDGICMNKLYLSHNLINPAERVYLNDGDRLVLERTSLGIAVTL